MPAIRALAFDAYGTLLDTVSATRRHAARVGPQWEAFSALWRAKQFEYTWVRSLAGPAQHVDFARIVDDALNFAAASHGVSDTALLAELRDSFERLEAFADAAAVLGALRDAGVARAILSNGTPSMLSRQLAATGLRDLFDHVLSVEAAGVFKPDPKVYQLAVDRFGCTAAEIGFVSSNPWDAFGAYAFGFPVFWINRKQQPDEYGLHRHVTILPDLSGLPARLG
jgi:2-haloacid dehalogenase